MKASIESKSLPIYVRFWNYLKRFPADIAEGSDNPPTVSGPAAAALVSAAFSCFLLMVNQHLCSISATWHDLVWDLGGWIPGSKNPDEFYGEIGSYSGKETVMLIGWLLGWVILAKLWQKQNIQFRTMFFCVFIFLVAAVVMNWHPLFPYLPLMPK